MIEKIVDLNILYSHLHSIFLSNIIIAEIEGKFYTFISLYNTNHQSIIFSSNISMAIKSILIDFPVCGFGLSICLS